MIIFLWFTKLDLAYPFSAKELIKDEQDMKRANPNASSQAIQ
jgi:hypothetical protein